MPLPPLPENNTMRLWIKQEGPRGAHETQFRFATGTTVVEAVATAVDICTAMAALMYDDQVWTSARVSAEGSIVSFPVAWTPIPGLNGNTFSDTSKPFFVTFVGRSTDGRKVTWTLGGCVFISDESYRIIEGENASVDAVIDAFRTASPAPTSISGLDPLMYPYANCGYNAYFQRKLRRTG